MSKYWLIKSEPSVYSIDNLKKDKKTLWDGVRNYQARNMMRDDWSVGDTCLFYHSNDKPIGVAGIAKVTKLGIPDPLQFQSSSKYFDPKATKEEPRWWSPEVKFAKKFKEVIPLDQIKVKKGLEKMILIKRGTRLSVQPVSKKEFDIIVTMAE